MEFHTSYSTMNELYNTHIKTVTCEKKIQMIEKYYRKYFSKMSKRLMNLRSYHEPMICLDEDDYADMELEYLTNAQIIVQKYNDKLKKKLSLLL